MEDVSRDELIRMYAEATEEREETAALVRDPRKTPFKGLERHPVKKVRAQLRAMFDNCSMTREARELGRRAGLLTAAEPTPEEAIAATLENASQLPVSFNAVKAWDEEVAPHLYRAAEAAFLAGIPLFIHATVAHKETPTGSVVFGQRVALPRGGKITMHLKALVEAAKNPSEVEDAMRFYRRQKALMAALEGKLGEIAKSEAETHEESAEAPKKGAIN